MTTAADLGAIAQELRDVVRRTFGILLDARQGFHQVANTITKTQATLMSQIPGATVATLDESLFAYSDGPPTHHPDDPAAPWLHATTQGELKSRNIPGGTNDVFIGNVAVVALYSYWEDHFRDRLAQAVGCSRNEIVAPVFGDIRLFRNSIVHHQAVALPEIAKCSLFHWFTPGDAISISTDQFREVVREIHRYLEQFPAA